MDNTHIINLSSYNKPKVIEDKRRDFVAYGEDNNFYQYLIDLYINSATNNAIINGIANMIYGKGLDALDSNTKTNEYAAMRSIVHDKCLMKIALDLKMLGEASFQVLYKDGKVVRAEHFPRQTLRAEKYNEEGDIEAYYYHPNWQKIKPNEQPERIASFGNGNGNEPEIKMIKRYVSGYEYYCPPDWMGGAAYADLESHISDYLINDVQNGFSGSKVINFNNGVPDREKQIQVKNEIMHKLTGARGEKIIVAFNNNAESQTTIEDVSLTDAPQHYEYLSNECVRKLIVAHRVTSPLLLGVRTENNGLGSNAEEIETASLLFDNITIKPYQQLIIDCIDDILAVNDISLKLYFKTLQPLAFIDTDNAVTDEAREEETGVKLSEEIPDTPDQMYDLLEGLGEDEDLDNWELVDEREVDYEQEEALDKMIGLASTGTARPNAKSEQDGETEDVQTGEMIKFKVRYQYTPLKVSDNSREFCQKMVAAKKLYRKEDIMAMSTKAVNAGFGPDGAANYDIWLYKGGARCHHAWLRKTYMAKGVAPDVKNPKAETSTAEARRKGFRPEANDRKVSTKPNDMPNNGFKN